MNIFKKLKHELRSDLNYLFRKKFGIFKLFHNKLPSNNLVPDSHHKTFKKEHAQKFDNFFLYSAIWLVKTEINKVLFELTPVVYF